jgi:hypothetical protein
MAHRTNLAVQSLSSMPMVSKLEDLLQSLYGYFLTPQSATLNSQNSLKLWTEDLKVLRNKVDQYVSTFEMGWEKIEDLDY